MKDYDIAIPLAPHRVWTIPFLKQGIEMQKPKPVKIGIVTSKEVFNKYFSEDKYTLVAEHPDYEPYGRKSKVIAKNREELRKWFFFERNEDYLLWLDSDIELIYSNTIKLLMKIMEKYEAYIVSNPYKARFIAEDGKDFWWGIGCTLMRKEIMDCSSFHAGDFTGSEHFNDTQIFSEDHQFYIGLRGGVRKFLQDNGYKGRFRVPIDYGEIPIIHHLKHIKKEDRDFTNLEKEDILDKNISEISIY